jgi:hypothetical protein
MSNVNSPARSAREYVDRRASGVAFRRVAILIPLVCAACTNPGGATQGTAQPQSISGPCTVERFFIEPYSTSNTHMVVNGTAQTCRFTLFNPDLQLVQNAALLTENPTHGRAEVAVANGDRSVAISYTPAPGYIGPDRFTATIEPGDKTVRVSVTAR